MTNAEWCIKNGIQFKQVGRRPCSDPDYESIGYYDMHGSFNECYKGACLGELVSQSILAWLDMEHKEPPILDESERQYLSAVIRPFKDDVQYIVKRDGGNSGFEYIVVNYKCTYDDAVVSDYLNFPSFEKGTMYKGMKPYRKYTLEELRL